MTLLEYITDLQSQGLSGEEIFAKAQEFKGRIKPEEVVEEVKTNVAADPVDAAVATKPENASETQDTELESENGSLDLQPQGLSNKKGLGSPQFMSDAMNNITTDILGNRFTETKFTNTDILKNYKIGSPQRTAMYLELDLKPDETIDQELFKLQKNQQDQKKAEDMTVGEITTSAIKNIPVGLRSGWESIKAMATNFIEDVAGEGAADFLVGGMGEGSISFIDPETNEEINFNDNKEKWLELSRLDRRTDTEIKTIYSGDKQEVGAAAELFVLEKFRKKARIDLEKINIGSIVEEFDISNIKDTEFSSGKKLYGGILTAFGGLVETALPALLTRGASLIPQITAPMYVDYNIAKANVLYGDYDDPLAELVKNDQTETTTPLLMGTFATGLEYIGLKGIAGQLAGKVGRFGPFVSLLGTQLKEGTTELGQTGIEEFSESLAKGKSFNEAFISSVDKMGSEEGLESFLSGVIASGGLAAPSTFSNMLITQGENRLKTQGYINQ